jgi:hypothetical protein
MSSFGLFMVKKLLIKIIKVQSLDSSTSVRKRPTLEKRRRPVSPTSDLLRIIFHPHLSQTENLYNIMDLCCLKIGAPCISTPQFDVSVRAFMPLGNPEVWLVQGPSGGIMQERFSTRALIERVVFENGQISMLSWHSVTQYLFIW